MSLSAREDASDPSRRIDENGSWDLVREANAGLTGVGVLVSLVGVGTLLLGLSNVVAGFDPVVPSTLTYGACLVAAGLVATPATRRRIRRRLSLRLSTYRVLVVYLSLVGLGLLIGRLSSGVAV